MADEVRSVAVRLSADVAGYVRDMRRAGAATGEIGTHAAGARRHLGAMFGTMATGVAALGLGKIVKDSVNLEAQYSTTMRMIGVATDTSGEKLAKLDRLAVKMGANTVFSANEAADAMLELAKGGLTPAQIQAGALSQALTLATAGGLRLDDAANAVVNTMGAFHLEASQARDAVAALAGGANASSADVSDMTQALAQVGTQAHNSGLSVQETTAALAAFANAGVKGSDAGTSLKTFLSRLVPTTNAAAKGFHYLHLGFTRQNGDFKSLAEIAQTLQDKFGGMSEAERTVAFNTLFGSDAQRAANILMDEGAKGIEKYIRATSDQTQAQKLSKAAMGGTAGALEQMRGAAETAELQLGRGLAPTVQDLAGELTDFIQHHDLEAWGRKAGRGLRTVIDDAKPFAKEVGSALKTVADATGAVADGFLKLPKPVQQAIITGAVVGVGAHKLGLDKPVGGLLKGLGKGAGTALGRGLVSRAAPLPVIVMNPGFGGVPGKGGGGVPPVVATGEQAAGKGAWWSKIPLPILPALGSQVLTPKDYQALKIPKSALGAGAGAGAGGLGAFVNRNLIALLQEAHKDALALTQDFKALPKGVQIQIRTPGLLKSVQSVKILADQYRLTPRQVVTTLAASGVVKTIGDVKQAQRIFHLTPKQIVTLVKTSGVDLSLRDVRDLQKQYHLTPSEVVTLLKSTGGDLAKADIKDLQKLYHLTPEQVRTLLRAQDQASATIAAVRARLFDLDGQIASTTIRTNHYDFYSSGAAAGPPNRTPARKATGGAISGPGTGTSDDVPIWASDGEHMWTAAEVAAAGGHRKVERLRYLARSGQLHGYATGGEIRATGPARRFAPVQTAPAMTAAGYSSLFRDLVVPAQPGATRGDVDQVVSSIVYHMGLAARSSRYTVGG